MIYVLVPAYNEAPTIGLLLWKVRQVFTAFEREYQLLVVDDASTDGTDEVLGPYTRALPLTLITHRDRQGYARSLEELLRLAVARSDRPRRDAAVTIQADFSEDPDDLPELIRRLESGADLVVADARSRPGMRFAERLARRLAPLAARPFCGAPGTEAAPGTLRAYRVGILARALGGRGPLLSGDGWGADLELLVRSATEARRVEVVPLARPARARQREPRLRPLRALLGLVTAARGLGRHAGAPAGGQEPPRERPPRRGRGRRGGRRRGERSAGPASGGPVAAEGSA